MSLDEVDRKALEGKGPYYTEFYLRLLRWTENGLTNMGVTWGPEAHKLTEEERCKHLLEVWEAPATRVDPKDIDGDMKLTDLKEW